MFIDIRHLHREWSNRSGSKFERVKNLNFGIQEMNPSNLGWCRRWRQWIGRGRRLGRGWWWCGGERERKGKEKRMEWKKKKKIEKCVFTLLVGFGKWSLRVFFDKSTLCCVPCQ